MTERASRPRRIIAAERRKQAIELRKAGATYEQIGRQLGVSGQAAHKMVQSVLKWTKDRTSETADDVRQLEIDRLDLMLVQLVTWITSPDTEPDLKLQAMDRVLKVQDRRSRYLGLDAPAKFAPTDPTGDNEFHGDMTDADVRERITLLESRIRERIGGGDPPQGPAASP